MPHHIPGTEIFSRLKIMIVILVEKEKIHCRGIMYISLDNLNELFSHVYSRLLAEKMLFGIGCK